MGDLNLKRVYIANKVHVSRLGINWVGKEVPDFTANGEVTIHIK